MLVLGVADGAILLALNTPASPLIDNDMSNAMRQLKQNQSHATL